MDTNMDTKKKSKNDVLLAGLAHARRKKAEPLVINILINMYEKDLPMHDADYVERRTKEVVDEMVAKIDYNSVEIHKATMDFLSVLHKNWKQSLPARREWRKKKLDKTEKRNARCEPVVYDIINDIMKDDLILSDEIFFKEAIMESTRSLFHSLFYGYMSEMFGELEISVNNSLSNAMKILWGGKEKEEVTSQQVDKILKSGKEVAKEVAKDEK